MCENVFLNVFLPNIPKFKLSWHQLSCTKAQFTAFPNLLYFSRRFVKDWNTWKCLSSKIYFPKWPKIIAMFPRIFSFVSPMHCPHTFSLHFNFAWDSGRVIITTLKFGVLPVQRLSSGFLLINIYADCGQHQDTQSIEAERKS